MKLNSLHHFLAVAERGSLRAAARDLDITQPAITRSIQDLEKELGVALFERRTKGVVLTPMGNLFLRRAQAVRNELRRAEEELAQLCGDLQGEVRVCLSSVAHMAMLPNALKPFRERYPDVKLDIIDAVLPAIERELTDGNVDCYIGPIHDQVPGDLAVEKLFDSFRVILGRKGHPLSKARSLAELVGAEWVTTSITHRAEDELTPLFLRHGLPAPKLVLQAHSALTFLFSIAYSDLLMMLPIAWTQAPLVRGALQRINVVESLPAPQICIVRRAGLSLTPAAEYFCDMMRRASRHTETLLQA